MYQYECPNGHEVELLIFYSDRDNAMQCEECGEALARVPTPVRTVTRHQAGAVLSNGSTVRGHWGKDAPKKRGG